jgi:hypothetical protein
VKQEDQSSEDQEKMKFVVICGALALVSFGDAASVSLDQSTQGSLGENFKPLPELTREKRKIGFKILPGLGIGNSLHGSFGGGHGGYGGPGFGGSGYGGPGFGGFGYGGHGGPGFGGHGGSGFGGYGGRPNYGGYSFSGGYGGYPGYGKKLMKQCCGKDI